MFAPWARQPPLFSVSNDLVRCLSLGAYHFDMHIACILLYRNKVNQWSNDLNFGGILSA